MQPVESTDDRSDPWEKVEPPLSPYMSPKNPYYQFDAGGGRGETKPQYYNSYRDPEGHVRRFGAIPRWWIGILVAGATLAGVAVVLVALIT